MALVRLPDDFAKLTANTDGRVWSDEQEAIFDWFENVRYSNLVVRARAGTGKTTTIIEGINRAPERRIMLAAFNKAIADELSGRVRNPSARVQTLHALGFAFCRKHIEKTEVDTRGERARHLAKLACEELSLTRVGRKLAPFDVVGTVAGLHTKIREILVDPLNVTDDAKIFMDEMLAFAVQFGFDGQEGGFWSTESVVEAALLAVEAAKQPTSTIDFADMIFLPLVNNWVVPVCDLMVIDECQDMSDAQLRMAIGSTKAADKGGRVCVVGDDLQAIYGFRGAGIGSLDRLKSELQAVELGLKTSYRCPQVVVMLAQAFAPDFRAALEAPSGHVESLKLATEVCKLARPGDFVLSRTNAALVSICLELIRAGKAAYIKGNDIGKSVAKLLDKLEFVSGCTTLKALSKALTKWQKQERAKLDKLSGKAIEEKLTRLTEQVEVLDAFIEGSKSLSELRDRISTSFDEKVKADAVMCSTVHKAKGLEAPRVFLIGKTFSRDSDEESNICYVAATRAKEELYLVGKTIAEFKKGSGDTPRSEWEHDNIEANCEAWDGIFHND